MNETKPTIDQEEATRTVETIHRNIYENALGSIAKRLEAAKAEHGPDIVERAAIGEAIVEFSNLINANRKYVPGHETDFLINIGIGAIAAAAYDAKKKSEEKRIITLR